MASPPEATFFFWWRWSVLQRKKLLPTSPNTVDSAYETRARASCSHKIRSIFLAIGSLFQRHLLSGVSLYPTFFMLLSGVHCFLFFFLPLQCGRLDGVSIQ